MFSRLRNNVGKGGFTIVELIVAVSVIATIAVVWMTYANSYKSASANAERLSDIETLALAAESYYRAKGDYPEPTGNRILFDADGNYEHSSSWAYGVSWAAAGDLFGAEFLAEVPRDPETGNHYGYGKRKGGVAAYDFASVDRRPGGFYAYVRGNYDGTALPSLVREYNGPNFVEDGKTDRLPYNPYENKIVAKIASYSGSVTVMPAKSLTGELEQGDTVTVPAGGFAVLHVSDGTEARIGSATSATELSLENLSTKDSKGLLTKVRLALNSGEIWTKAPKLREDRSNRSELEITTGTAVASVRGTVFWVAKTAAATEITLVVGKLEITTASGPVSAEWLVGGLLAVEDGDVAKKVSISNSAPGSWTVSPAPEAAGKSDSWVWAKAKNKAKLKKVKRASGAYVITFDNGRGFNKLSVPVNGSPGATNPSKPVTGTGIVSITFTASELAYLPGYPEERVSNATASEFVRLPLLFEGADGLSAETEIIIPRGDGNFEYDEDSVPEWTSMNCSKGYARFGKDGCQPDSLRALAKYDAFVGQGNEFGDSHIYDREGKTLPVTQNFLSAKDMSWKNYVRALWRWSNNASADSWAYRAAVNGAKGIIMETSNRDDYLSYDISRLDLNKQDFAITVGVLSSGLGRSYQAIEKETWAPPLSGERRAYLWSLPDGTSLYLRTLETDFGTTDANPKNALVLTDSTGLPKNVLAIPSGLAGAPLQNASVETRFSTEKGRQYAKVSVRLERTSSIKGDDFESQRTAVSISDPVRVYVGSTKPKVENGIEKFDYNWGWKRDCWNASIEIIDSFALKSFD